MTALVIICLLVVVLWPSDRPWPLTVSCVIAQCLKITKQLPSPHCPTPCWTLLWILNVVLSELGVRLFSNWFYLRSYLDFGWNLTLFLISKSLNRLYLSRLSRSSEHWSLSLYTQSVLLPFCVLLVRREPTVKLWLRFQDGICRGHPFVPHVGCSGCSRKTLTFW